MSGNALKEFVILTEIESEWADGLKSIGMDHIIVVVLESKVFPDDVVHLTFDRRRYGTASDVRAFRAEVECVPVDGTGLELYLLIRDFDDSTPILFVTDGEVQGAA